MKKQSVIILCNAILDDVRTERGIYTDSPAATKKVHDLCDVLSYAGFAPVILSLGRGKSTGKKKWYRARAVRENNSITLYGHFSNVRLLSPVISVLGMALCFARLARGKHCYLLFYNRSIAYVPTLIYATLTGHTCYLDIEDGDVARFPCWHPRHWWVAINIRLFDYLCRNGAILACSQLTKSTSINNTMCYYGIADNAGIPARFQNTIIRVLMSGTIEHGTGATLLANAIQHIREQGFPWASSLAFEICGKGDGVETLRALQNEFPTASVRVHGRLTFDQYKQLLKNCDIGLSLKLIGGQYDDTTFPSKVIEYASAGLCIVCTDISDVRKLLSDDAYYLEQNDAIQLSKLLCSIATSVETAEKRAHRGQISVRNQCSKDAASQLLKSFFTDKKP